MKHLLKMSDLTPDEVAHILDVADELKAQQKAGGTEPLLKGKSVALMFSKNSTRTRTSFEVGVYQLGGLGNYMNAATELQSGRGEPLKDTARVLGRYYDCVVWRTYRQSDLEEFAEFAGVPVINGLTDYAHPCQVLADLMTIRERRGALAGQKLCFVGDGSNMANSLIVGGLLSGMKVDIELNFAVCADNAAKVQEARRIAEDLEAIGIGVNLRELTWKDYLAALQLETYTEALNRYGECRSLQLLFDAPEGTLSVTLADNQSIHVTRLWLKNAPSESYYLAEPIDWQLLDRLIVLRPALRVWFSLPGQDEDSCFFAGVYSMTQTLPDGTVQVLQEPDEGNYSAFGTTGGGRTVRLEFGQTLLEPYTVTCQTPDGSERRIFTQDELRGGRVPLLPGESADYTVAARLQGEDGSTYDAVFCFRYDRLAGGT